METIVKVSTETSDERLYIQDITSLCPLCGQESMAHEYTNINILGTCEECTVKDTMVEYLVCLSHENTLKLSESPIGTSVGCATRISEEEAREYIESRGWEFNGGIEKYAFPVNEDDPETTIQECTFIKCRLIEVTGVEEYRDPDTTDVVNKSNYFNVNIEKCDPPLRRIRKVKKPVLYLSDVPFPYDYGGVYMGYTGKCPGCKTEYVGSLDGGC